MPHTFREHVVVLHGWGLSSFATQYWSRRFKLSGYIPSAFSYPSISRDLHDNSAKLADHVNALPGDGPVHFVGHSLGGLMIMQYLAQHACPRLGRVVMVGSPFQGSAAMQRLKANPYGHLLLGKTIVQWQGVEAQDLPKGLELGTIAGTSPLGMGMVFGGLQGPHDGTVSLAETHVPFATDRLVMRVTHSEMLVSPQVAGHIIHFIKFAKFTHL